jgi:hypothetical protein
MLAAMQNEIGFIVLGITRDQAKHTTVSLRINA